MFCRVSRTNETLPRVEQLSVDVASEGAVEAGAAHGWHTLVYGMTLAVYSLPVLPGLMSYERQTLLGFMHAVSRSLRLSENDCRDLLDQLSPTLPSTMTPILGEDEDPRPPKLCF